MRAEGWRGKGKKDIPQWRIEARKAKTVANSWSFSTGGLPRHKKSDAVSLPKFKCLEDAKP